MIREARHPLVLIGNGANRKLTQKMLRELIDKLRIPFIDTQMGKGVVDESHPLFIGTAALSAKDYLHRAIQAADVIINVGHDVIEKPPFVMSRSGTSRVIHINFTSAQVDEVYFPHHEVVGDIANAVWQIKERLEAQPHWDFEYFSKVRADLQAHLTRECENPSFPLLPQRIGT